MSVVTGTTATAELSSDDTIFELTGGENPLTFLNMSESDTALGPIAWMDDTDRIEGWRRAETQFFNPPRKTVLKALDKQARGLDAGASPPIYHEEHTRTTEIVAADEEIELEYGESEQVDADHDDSADEPEADPVHPDARGLEAGEIPVLDRGDATEYIFPATLQADEPYLLRTVDAEADEQITELIDQSFDEAAKKLDGSPTQPRSRGSPSTHHARPRVLEVRRR